MILLVPSLQSAMAGINASNNEVVGSEDVHIGCITYNYNGVYPNSHTVDPRKWLLETAQRARSKQHALPSNFKISSISKEIMRSSHFKDCVTQRASTLILRGSMGSGKSTTMCYFVHDLAGREHVAVAYILFDIEAPDEHVVCKVLMHFIQQLAVLADSGHNEIVLEMAQRYPDGCPPARQTADALVAIIKRTAERQEISCRKATCFILDGLDEFQNRQELHHLLNHLKNIQVQTGCGVIMSSRLDIVSISTIFGVCPRKDIVAHASDVHDFIRTAALGHTAHGLLEKKPELERTIYNAVIKGSHEL